MREIKSKVKASELEGITAGELADGMPNMAAVGVSLDDVKGTLATIDIETLKKTTVNRIQVKIWEEGDLIGGIALRAHPNPEHRARLVRNLDAGGNIYLVYIDGKLVYNQWHIKGEGIAPITDDRLQDVVDDHIKEIAQSLFHAAVRTAVLKKL